MTDENDLNKMRQYWDGQAPTFDQDADHGLRDAHVRSAWDKLYVDHLKPKQKILDIGCGTGSISVLLAELGHEVTGIDLSPKMIDLAKSKASDAKKDIVFHVMDASYPQFDVNKFDVIVCRHILWALPHQKDVLKRWLGLLRESGNFMFVEGFWHTGGGLRSNTILSMLPENVTHAEIIQLSNQPQLWGGEVTDERYVIVGQVS